MIRPALWVFLPVLSLATLVQSQQVSKCHPNDPGWGPIVQVGQASTNNIQARLSESPCIFQLPTLPREKVDAIPVRTADLVVIGKVISAQATLVGTDFVYSVFRFVPERILKADRPLAGSVVEVGRYGGRLQLPTGQIAIRAVYGRGMPQVGQSYILFLKALAESRAFTIITGYEVKGDTVFALDGIQLGRIVFAEYLSNSGLTLKVFEQKIEQAGSEPASPNGLR